MYDNPQGIIKTLLKGCAATQFYIFTTATIRDADSKIDVLPLEKQKESEYSLRRY